MGKIVKLKNANNEYTYPVTKTEAVYIEDNKTTLKDYLDAMSITQSARPAEIVTFNDGANGVPVKELTLNIEPHQEGSGDPNPENVRPISGYTAMTVTRAGKNLLPFPYADGNGRTVAGVTYTVNADGSISISGTATTNTTDFYLVGARSEYAETGLNGALMVQFGGYETGLSFWVIESGGETIAIRNTPTEIDFNPDGTYRIFIRVANGTTINTTVYPMIRSADFSDIYEKPTGHTDFDIIIPTAAATVYGGTLTVNDDGSGTLTVDMVWTTVSALSWSYSSTYSRFAVTSLADIIKHPDSNYDNAGMLSSTYRSGSVSGDTGNRIAIATSGNLYIYDDAFTDTADFVSARGDTQIVYKLASPTVYTLTASQITTLLGDNTIWMNADGTIDLTYRADLTKYITNIISSSQGD